MSCYTSWPTCARRVTTTRSGSSSTVTRVPSAPGGFSTASPMGPASRAPTSESPAPPASAASCVLHERAYALVCARGQIVCGEPPYVDRLVADARPRAVVGVRHELHIEMMRGPYRTARHLMARQQHRVGVDA